MILSIQKKKTKKNAKKKEKINGGKIWGWKVKCKHDAMGYMGIWVRGIGVIGWVFFGVCYVLKTFFFCL